MLAGRKDGNILRNQLTGGVLRARTPSLAGPAENEWSLLLAVCSDLPTEEKAARVRGLLAPEIRWDALLSLAESHGVLPILAQVLLSVADQVPDDELQKLKQSYQANLHKALLLSRQFVHIVERLSHAEIEFLPYKGLTLAETIYGDIALRQSGDIDLLIHAADLKRVAKTVEELGFTPHLKLSEHEQEAYLTSGYEYAFDGAAGSNLLEVQWAIEPRFYAVDLEVEGLFRRAQKVKVAGTEIRSLSAEDLFLVLTLHAAKHAWGKLIWLCDLARASRLPTLNWEWIGEQAKKLGIVRILRVSLMLAQRMIGSVVPAPAAQHLPDDLAARSLAEEVETHITGQKPVEVESIAYFRLMMRSRERRSDRIRFLSRLIFTPGPGEWAAVRLPKPLFPLYRVVRITRLAARIVGR